MANRDLQNLLRRKMSRRDFLVFAGVTALSMLGVLRILSELTSRAAGIPVAFEPESGTTTSGAAAVSISGASGGSAIKFSKLLYPYGTYGSYKPSSRTTGVRAGTNLVAYTGRFGAISGGILAIRTDGITLENFDIPAYVRVLAADVTIKNCSIRGPVTVPGTGGYSLITSMNHATDSSSNASNLLVQDCTLVPQTPSSQVQGYQGASATIERCNIYNVVDGIDPLGDGVIMLANYIHDLAWYTVDSGHSDGHTHNDCVQPGGGSFTAKYNNFQAFLSPSVGQGPDRPYDQANSAFLLADNTVTGLRNTVISTNWIDGGAVAFNAISAKNTTWGDGSQGPFTLTDNIFGDNQYYNGATIELTSAAEASAGNFIIAGNTYGAVDRPLVTASRSGTTLEVNNGIVYAG